MPNVIETTQNSLVNLLEILAAKPFMSEPEMDSYWQALNQIQMRHQVEISEINHQVADDPMNEYARLHNRGSLMVDISGWQLCAGAPEQRVTFAEGTVLAPFASLNVYTGAGEVNFGSSRPIWNNRGDVGTLYHSDGTVVSRLAYGKKAHPAIIISHIHFDGENGRGEGDEYVELTNLSEADAAIAGWRIESLRNSACFVFPQNTKMSAGERVKVFTSKSNCQYNEFSFESAKAIWHNQSGSAKLIDYQDNEVSTYHYG
ncbi:lamin tail domain-containing protein [Vibrio sp. SM6]|uniref:Lamin tail domain-containing protein n=1 Tax=Vibrio agarilyticus TaxID=2726741 RepID=A0A7X8TNT7_9VIBR|nr:lamin tail domain-containing protein [Vibrio agarilyticus]NLS11954.1 lamin tail domain-containing protein [Vibrio agarilyticus]